MIRVLSNARGPIWVTSSVADSDGKKTEEGMTMSTLETHSNLVATANPPEAQNLMSATTQEASDIVTNCTI
jgi:protoporphyrinogen oxidase